MLGFGAGELAHMTVEDILDGEDIVRTAAQTLRLWEGDIEFADLEQRYRRKDGAILWARVTTALVHEDGAEARVRRAVSAGHHRAQGIGAGNWNGVNKQLIAASRQAGMAEVATNVLHNVGNILNSVNISASLLAERIKQSKSPGISRTGRPAAGAGTPHRGVHRQ